MNFCDEKIKRIMIKVANMECMVSVKLGHAVRPDDLVIMTWRMANRTELFNMSILISEFVWMCENEFERYVNHHFKGFGLKGE